MLSLLPSSRLAIESALENGRSVNLGRATVSPSAGLPPFLRGLAADLAIVGLLQLVADAKEQTARDSQTIAKLETDLAFARKTAGRFSDWLSGEQLAHIETKNQLHAMRERFERI